MIIYPPNDNTFHGKYALCSWALVGMSNCKCNYTPGQEHNIYLKSVIITNLNHCFNEVEFSNQINIKSFFILNKCNCHKRYLLLYK